MYIASLWDYFYKGLGVTYDKKGEKVRPTTNLRFLANPFNVGSIIVIVLILYYMLKLLFHLMR